METSNIIFISQLVCTLAFTLLIHFLTPWAKKTAVAEAPTDAVEASLPDISVLDPLFREIVELRDTVQRTNSPATFTQHALASRKLIPLEKKWQMVFSAMSEEDRKPYKRILISRGEMPKEEANKVAQDGNAQNPLSFFAQVMRTDLSPEERQKLYQDMLVQAARGSGSSNTSSRSMWINFMGPLKLLTSWSLVHIIVGWAPKLRSIPIFTLPTTFFGGWIGHQPWFPVSQLLHAVPTESVKSYVVDWSQVQSDVNFLASPPQCQQYLTFGLFATTFLLGTALKHMWTEIGPKGCVPKALGSARSLLSTT